ncbi:MAG: hypothetical protein MJ192_01705 [Clostridia bacterium]|nr:hypothetical protein [Clostridia bacterium]
MSQTPAELLDSLLSLRAAALPLSECRLLRPYLLDRAGIPTSGTALFFAVPYLIASDARDPGRNVSLYAVPRDYHGYMRQLSDELLPRFHAAFPGHRFALFSDHSPVDEVDGAARAGLGVRGLNGLLITREWGSFVFIAELVTDMPYPEAVGMPAPDVPDAAPPCQGCGACLRACPGGCTSADKSACLSALTQKKGTLTDGEADSLRTHTLVWGCDTCQLVCPMNRAALAGLRDTPVTYFREHRLPRLTLPALDAMPDDEFLTRAYSWRGRAVIRRNLALKTSEKEDTV